MREGELATLNNELPGLDLLPQHEAHVHRSVSIVIGFRSTG